VTLRSVIFGLALLLIVSGCSDGSSIPQPPTPEVQAPTVPPADGPKPVTQVPTAQRGPGTPVASLFPAQDLEVVFRTLDLGADEASSVTQLLLCEPERIAVTYNGRPYFTWTIDTTGLWREDPKNPGTLLRYLPPELHDGLTWSQPSGTETVWFQVTRHQSYCHVRRGATGDGCWRLTVINRQEQLVYLLAPGLGPVKV
jgi:hypothetical protein